MNAINDQIRILESRLFIPTMSVGRLMIIYTIMDFLTKKSDFSKNYQFMNRILTGMSAVYFNFIVSKLFSDANK